MTRQLLTSWSAYDEAARALLERTQSTLSIFDWNLSALKLEQPERASFLRRLLAARAASPRVTLIVQEADHLRRDYPRLIELLTTYSPALTITIAAPELHALDDSFLIGDGRHAVIRFHRDHPRSRLIVDDPDECRPYVERFAAIRDEGGEAFAVTTLGL